jgi:type I restriction enzyme S subunit
MKEWKEVLLTDITTKIGDGLHGTPKYDNGGEYYFINGNNLVNGKIIIKEDTKRVNESEYLKHSKPINERTLLLGINGTIGNVAYYKNEQCMLGKSACYMNFNSEVDLKFIYYTLVSKDFQNYIEGIATGTTIPNVPLKGLREYSFKLPPLPEQTAIASVLSSLDDKIDLLHRQNATLEKMAETLFRQWFVEETKVEWEDIKVKDVCLVITKGTTPTTLGRSFKENGINFIKAESLTDVGTFIPEKFAFIDDDTYNLLKRSQIQEGDVLITIAGTIGRIGYVTKDILPANTNQAIGIMRVNRKIINPYFLYCLFNSTEIKNDFDGRVVHAVQPNLSLGEIGDIEFKLPPSKVLIEGMQKIEGLFTKKNKNTTQICTLTVLRDTLLPKLMSGEVKVEIEI